MALRLVSRVTSTQLGRKKGPPAGERMALFRFSKGQRFKMMLAMMPVATATNT